jgi:hypothetical protein
MSNRLVIAVAVITATYCFSTSHALAQRPVLGFTYGRPNKGFDRSGGGYAVFGPTDRLTLSQTIRNDEEVGVPLTLKAGFFASMSITLVGAENEVIRSRAEWSVAADCGGGAANQACTTISDVFLPPDSYVVTTVTLTPINGREFPVGEYRIAIDLRPARAQIVHASSGVEWNGFLWAMQRSISLAIQRIPTTGEGLQTFLKYEAEDALERRHYGAALGLFQRMAALDPAAPGPQSGIGVAFLSMGQYAEAAAAFERVLSYAERFDTAIPEYLAVAYVGLRQEVRAEAMLSRFVAASEIPRLMESARARVKRTPPAR